MKGYYEILEDMLGRVSSKIDRREGSVIYDALAPAAAEMAQLYIEMSNIMNEAFADTQSRDFLVRRAAERGVVPHESTNAVLLGEFEPTNIDVTGKRFRIDTMYYVASKSLGGGQYEMTCEAQGVEGNHYFGSLIPVEYVPGLVSGLITDILIPGQNAEETETFRARYLQSLSSQGFGGNVKDYLDKTKAIPGVGGAKITPVWDGGGTVKITILDSNFDMAGEPLVADVQEKIDPTRDGAGIGIAPIGHVVTVDTVKEVEVFVTTRLLFDEGYSWETVRDEIEVYIRDYLLELRKDWEGQSKSIVRLARIESDIFSIKGILDINDSRINGLAENLVLSGNEIPVFGGAELVS